MQIKSPSFFQIGSSPLSARASFPVAVYIIGVVIVAAVILGIWFLTKKIIAYRNSEEYIKNL